MKTTLWKTLLLALVLTFIAPQLAFAHASLDHAEPKVGSEVDVSPAELKIWFTDEIDLTHSTIQVLDSAGKQVDKKDFHLDAKDKTQAIISLPALPPGTYKVIWTATCIYGHKTQGTFTFVVKPKNTATQPNTSAPRDH